MRPREQLTFYFILIPPFKLSLHPHPIPPRPPHLPSTLQSSHPASTSSESPLWPRHVTRKLPWPGHVIKGPTLRDSSGCSEPSTGWRQWIESEPVKLHQEHFMSIFFLTFKHESINLFCHIHYFCPLTSICISPYLHDLNSIEHLISILFYT